MKFVVQFSRVLVGLLFILSGLLKLNDPAGFSYKLEEYFTVFSGDVEAEQDSVITTITFGEQTVEVVTHLLKTSKSIDLTVTQENWTTFIGENGDTLMKSNLHVLVNGSPALQGELTGANWSVSEKKLSIRSKIGDKEIISEDYVASLPPLDAQSASADVTSYIKPDSWAVGFFNWLGNYALFFAIFVSWLEAILGFALLIGWQSRFTAWMLVLLTAFFTFLTLYSWIYDKVTDCGCFGDALPMTPEESFYKNVVIGVFILIIFFWSKHIKPVFSNPFGVKVLTVLTILLVGFSLYCKHYLPVVDFLHYGEGKDLREGMKVKEGERATDHVRTVYEYKAKDGSGKKIEVVFDSDVGKLVPTIDFSKWEFVGIIKEETLEKAYVPPIHDFAFYDFEDGSDYLEEFFQSDKKLLVVVRNVKEANTTAIKKINELAHQWVEDGNEVWALTASSQADVEEFRHEHQISDFKFFQGDDTNLKSIIRSNPGLLLITDTSYVEEVWPATRLPKYKKILKKSE